MPIRQIMQGTAFDAAEVNLMASVFDDILRDMRLDRTDPVATNIAKNVIRHAQQGERDPARLRERAAAFLRT